MDPTSAGDFTATPLMVGVQADPYRSGMVWPLPGLGVLVLSGRYHGRLSGSTFLGLTVGSSLVSSYLIGLDC